ncbi:MAG: dimethylsulfonioproprionate lyase family protein [Pseudomonadota bacterium]
MGPSDDRLRANALGFVRASLDCFTDYAGANRTLVDKMLEKGEAFLAEAPDAPVRDTDQAPVARWLEPAIAHGRDQISGAPDHPVFTCLENIAEQLPWELGYDGPSLSEEFRANFGYVFIAGPGGLVECDWFAAGVTMMGPDIYYDWHHHPAHEFYINFSQTASWGLDLGELSRRKFQDMIVIPGGTHHAMRSGSQPFLAPWLWIGDIHTPSEFSEPS